MPRYLISFDDGSMDHIPKAVIGGFSIIEVCSREETLVWACASLADWLQAAQA